MLFAQTGPCRAFALRCLCLLWDGQVCTNNYMHDKDLQVLLSVAVVVLLLQFELLHQLHWLCTLPGSVVLLHHPADVSLLA